ncbi:hypothetical protein GALMADRAFT_871712 [Galerina marginata CBS 339.88]|uniref:Uncharacterized protein n=1 Tax=Galerina marginata (strain CBS 339.88) TaxID=685588 RepID=A0A067TT86_GALM3|nr:hypothetical protein GALMADRAFT_871712 [Galerina marginata CBS 339.88]
MRNVESDRNISLTRRFRRMRLDGRQESIEVVSVVSCLYAFAAVLPETAQVVRLVIVIEFQEFVGHAVQIDSTGNVKVMFKLEFLEGSYIYI